jgi:twitching motility protein PilI
MRSPFDILEGYEQRSLAHAVQLPERQFAADIWRGVGYRVGTRRLVSDFREVVEIVPMPPVTPVPGGQPWLLGVGNLRGNLFPVVDLKQFMEGRRTVLHEGQRVLIMRQSGGDVALTIDELYGQRSFEQVQAIEPGELAQGRYAHFIDRAFRSDTQEWGVFSLSLLSRTPEFRQAAA